MTYPTSFTNGRRRRNHIISCLIVAMIVAKGVSASATSPLRWRSMAGAPAAFVSNASREPSSPHPRPYRQNGCNGMRSHSSRRMELWPRRHERRTFSLGASGSSSDMTANELQMSKDALKMVNAAIEAVDPNVAVRDRLKIEWEEDRPMLSAKAERGDSRELVYDLSRYDNIRIVSFGKASAAMALAAAEVMSNSLSRATIPTPKLDGVVIIKDDHATDEEIEALTGKHDIVVRSASHPVPDARSVAGADEILRLASSSDARTLMVVCVSGGGSALFCSPRAPLKLEDLMATNSRLLESGMPIEHMNVIRKRLERGKGGGLAAAAHPATVLTLILSDIIGDPLDLIASGPTVPDDGSDWDDACELVEEYGLDAGGDHQLPRAVLDLLRMGREGELDDTPKSSHPAFSPGLGESILVGNNYAAVTAAAEEAERLGYNPVLLGTRVGGEASCVAGTYVAMAEMLSRQRDGRDVKHAIAALPVALIAGGETVVTLPPGCEGKGGRNQELALAAAVGMREMGLRDVVLASVGTDGTDGPTDAAGAIVHGGLVDDGTVAGAKEALKNHDAYAFFDGAEGARSLVMTGPTGTNVADVCITLVR